jgi:hypothetical protein
MTGRRAAPNVRGRQYRPEKLLSEGLQRATLLLALSKPARLYVTRPILDEYTSVLSRPHLHMPLKRMNADSCGDDK